MKFRTEIGELRGSFSLSHDDRIVMLGSCFSDEIGRRLDDCGFNVIHNPAGPLFNPASIARVITREEDFTTPDLYLHDDGIYHCLDYASRYSSADAGALLATANVTRRLITSSLNEASAAVITFGTTRVYQFLPGDYPAGNCHRLPAAMFVERNLSVEDIVDLWRPLLPLLPRKLIFTLSPIRYTAYGLESNSLAKATLRVAIDKLCSLAGADYFPAFEILTDDLRDYRFYAEDMKHPSDVAVDYIFDCFSDAYFDNATRLKAAASYKESRRNRHIPNNNAQ
ncbi:MAG: GSCFA domain-containing protein [Muribaculaceae bacterium]|nr:GSCFA domain-containing protein [Muribaculaceae bacterium]